MGELVNSSLCLLLNSGVRVCVREKGRGGGTGEHYVAVCGGLEGTGSPGADLGAISPPF